MKYVLCPICKRKASANTIYKMKKCNNCAAEISMENSLDYDLLLKKIKYHWKVMLVIDFSDFIKTSSYTNTFKYRTIVDFQKLMDIDSHENPIKFKESWLKENFYLLSAYKLPKSIDSILVFLFSKSLIKFDINNYPWSSKNLHNWYYYNLDILVYYYDNSRCHDCGKYIENVHNYCDNCSSRRSLRNLVSTTNLRKNFNDERISEIFKEFVDFLLKSQLTFSRVNEISCILIYVFKFMEETMSNTNEKKVMSLTRNPLQEIVNVNWLEIAFKRFSASEKYKNRLHFLPATYSHFCAFLYHKSIFLPTTVLPDLLVQKNTIVMAFEEKNSYKRISEKISNLPTFSHKMLNYYLELESKKIEVLEKKNAVKTLTWKTVENNFYTFINFLNWIIDRNHITDWNEINEESVNVYVLNYEKQQNRELIKRKLFNLFEFGRKNKFMFINPILPFKAKSFDITEKPLTPKNHVEIYRKIFSAGIYNPTDALLVSLCYFHVLTTKQVQEIKISDINILSKSIEIRNRPPVYLDEHESSLLINHLKLTEDIRTHHKIPFLFFVMANSFANKVSRVWILNHCKKLTTYTPKELRRSALQYYAELNGPEFLYVCFGLSLTHSSRFGNLDDWIIEDIIASEIEDFNP